MLIYVAFKGLKFEGIELDNKLVDFKDGNKIGELLKNNDATVKGSKIYKPRILTNFMYLIGYVQSINLILANTDGRFNVDYLDSDVFFAGVIGCVGYFWGVVGGGIDVGLKKMNKEEMRFILGACGLDLVGNFFVERLERIRTNKSRIRTKEEEKRRVFRGVVLGIVISAAALDLYNKM